MSKPIATTIVEKALDLIADPSHWTTNTIARDANGYPVDGFSDEAVSFCAVGAVRRAAYSVMGGDDITSLNSVTGDIRNDLDALSPGLDLAMTNDIEEDGTFGHHLVIGIFKKYLEQSK